jgi:tetrahydromethanopterin S-methyltransferase subunit A
MMSSHQNSLKDKLEALGAFGSVPNLDNLETKTLKAFAKVTMDDPQACFDMLFATPKQKSKVVQLLAEFATKKALAQQARACDSADEANALEIECNTIYAQLPQYARWAEKL